MGKVLDVGKPLYSAQSLNEIKKKYYIFPDCDLSVTVTTA